METLLHAGLGNALAAALLASLVAGFGLITRRPALLHALWVVVLLKLITPPLWSVPVVPSVEGEIEGQADPAELLALTARPEPPTSEPVFRAVPHRGAVPPDSVEIVEAPAWRGTPRPETPSRAGTAPTWRTVVAWTWVAGSLVTFGIAAVRVRRFGRLLKEARPAPRDVLDRVGELATRLGLSCPPEVRMTPGAVSPMLWALGGRPLLIVPDDLWERLDGARRDTLLVHELAHLKRRDHWVRGLELLATGLYWWHPVVWWSRRALHEAEEQCCDAWVVWAIPGAARTYAEALLDTVDFLSGAEPSVPWAASGLGHVRHLKRRLVMILNGTTPRSLSWSGILATLGLCAALLPLSPSWADEPPTTEPSETFEVRAEQAQAPEPDRRVEEVLIIKSDLGKLDEEFIPLKEEVITRVHKDAMKPLQAQLDELSGKEKLSKEDEIRRSAIQHAIEELKRALGDRSEDADPKAVKPRKREGKEGADRRPDVREERVERKVQVDPAPHPNPHPGDSLGDDPGNEAHAKEVAEFAERLRVLQRTIRSKNDPAIRAQREKLESAIEGMAAHREALRGKVQNKNADLDKARAELREQGTELSKKRAEFMEAEQRYQEARRRLAEMERPDRVSRNEGPLADALNLRGPVTFRQSYPFPRPLGGLGNSGNLLFRAPEIREMRLSPKDESRRISELEKKLDRVLEELKGLKEEKPSKSE